MNTDRIEKRVGPETYIVAERILRCVSVRKCKASYPDARVTDFEAAQGASWRLSSRRNPMRLFMLWLWTAATISWGFLKLEEGTVNMATVHLRDPYLPVM